MRVRRACGRVLGVELLVVLPRVEIERNVKIPTTAKAATRVIKARPVSGRDYRPPLRIPGFLSGSVSVG